jgi:nucleoside-diphosphate-sugar epimerase
MPLEPDRVDADLANTRILVTGASGFIGTHLVKRLSDAGAKVTSLDLRPPRVVVDGVKYVIGDVRDLTQFDCGPIDRIFNLAAVHTTPGHPDYEYYDTNVNGALEVTRLAERLGVRHICFTSSISIYGPSEDRKIEDSIPAPVSAYGKSKLIAEKIHRSWSARESSRKLDVVRPAVVFGGGEGGNFARMAALLKKGVFVFPGRRDTIKSCIYVEDLIDLMLAAGKTKSAFELLNGCYPECPTLEDIVLALTSRYFRQARLIDLPAWFVIGTAKVLSGASGFGFGIHPDRVTKLIRSTWIYPNWAASRGFFDHKPFASGIERWAAETKESFV